MTKTRPDFFLDTNVMVYAFDNSDIEKKAKAKHILEACFDGRSSAAISIQVVNEFCLTLSKKIANPVSLPALKEVTELFLKSKNFVVLGADSETVRRTLDIYRPGRHYWDCFLAATMIENGVGTIYTENLRDFEGIDGIKAINPFAKSS